MGIPLIFYFGVAGIYILGVSIISFIVALCIPHLTIEGCLQKKQWKAFKRFMTKKQYKNFDTEDLLNNLNDLFVFGVVFGLSNKFNRDLAGFIPESGHINYVYWYIIHGSGNHQSKTFNADSFSKSFSTMVTSTNGALSSSTGSGGGGSVGGGGGASSGGGGAG